MIDEVDFMSGIRENGRGIQYVRQDSDLDNRFIYDVIHWIRKDGHELILVKDDAFFFFDVFSLHICFVHC